MTSKILNRLFKAIEILIAVLLGIMIVLVFANVVARKVFNYGFVWSEEITRFSFIYLVYLGAIVAMKENRHLLVETVLVRLSHKVKKYLYAALQIIIIVLMILLTKGSYMLVIQTMNDSWAATHLPQGVIWASGLIAGTAIAVIAAVNLYRLFILKIPVEELITPHSDDGAENKISD